MSIVIEMISYFLSFRYRTLGSNERKRLEEDEDRLLSTILYNLVSHMVMMGVKQTDIKRKVLLTYKSTVYTV